MEKRFFDDIERLRGFACILILIQHIAWICPMRYVYNIVPSCLLTGSGAVHIFFAISGFVITLSLKDKISAIREDMFMNRFNLAREFLSSFYMRRIYRLLPVMLAVIAILFVFLACTSKDTAWINPLLRTPIEILGGMYNYSVEFLVRKESIHFGGVGPFWTLAVEAQFYALWPLVLLLCRSDNARMIISLCLGCLFLFVIEPTLIITYGYKYYAIYNNVAELFLGSFIAFVYDNSAIRTSSKCSMIMTFLFVMVVWFYPNVQNDELFYMHAVVSIASVAAVAMAVFSDGCLNIPLLGKVFEFLGKRSYSFYAVQLTLANIVVWFTNSVYFPKEQLSEYEFYVYQLVIFIVALVILSDLMYRFLELPFRKIRCK